MKTWKKLFALLLTLLLLGSISASALAAEPGEESLTLYQGVESFRMKYETDIDMHMSVVDESIDMDMEIAGDVDYILNPEHARMTMDMLINDTEQDSIIYYEKAEDGYRAVVSDDGGETWSEQPVELQDLPSGSNISIDYLTKLTELAQTFDESGLGEIKGVPVTIYAGVLSGEDASDILSASGSLSTLESSLGLEVSELASDDLGDLPITIAVDNETGLLMRYDLDITEIEQNLVSRVMESVLRSQLEGVDLPEGMDIGDLFSLEVNRAVTSTILYDYNQVEEFTLPEVTVTPEMDDAA